MAFSYECDFNLQAQRLTPVTKRLPVRLGVLKSISAPIQWNRDNFFNSYLGGDASPAWDSGTTYYSGSTDPMTKVYTPPSRVNYLNKIYESTNPPIYDPIAKVFVVQPNLGHAPTDISFWSEVVGDFRGATERIKYNCQTLMMEYIINRWFGTQFYQPLALGGVSGNIGQNFWIVNLKRDSGNFVVAENSVIDGVFVTSEVPQFSGDIGEEYVGEVSGFSPGAIQYNFEVHYPLVIIPNTIDPAPKHPNYYQMTSLVDKYKIFGSTVKYIGH